VARTPRQPRQPSFRQPHGLRLEPARDPHTLVLSFPVPNADLRELLSGSEAAIAREILAGRSNAEIARRRGTAIRTIANQIASIYRKLGVRSRLELGLFALAGRQAVPRP
jgi:DNA-binding NarL/FixJ family response regulator